MTGGDGFIVLGVGSSTSGERTAAVVVVDKSRQMDTPGLENCDGECRGQPDCLGSSWVTASRARVHRLDAATQFLKNTEPSRYVAPRVPVQWRIRCRTTAAGLQTTRRRRNHEGSDRRRVGQVR